MTIKIALHEQITKKHSKNMQNNNNNKACQSQASWDRLKNLQNYLDEMTLDRFCTGRYLPPDHILLDPSPA
jgi:DNA-binding IscR family transcriptional regulator